MRRRSRPQRRYVSPSVSVLRAHKVDSRLRSNRRRHCSRGQSGTMPSRPGTDEISSSQIEMQCLVVLAQQMLRQMNRHGGAGGIRTLCMSDGLFRAQMLLHSECSRALIARRLAAHPSSSEAVQPVDHFAAFCRAWSPQLNLQTSSLRMVCKNFSLFTEKSVGAPLGVLHREAFVVVGCEAIFGTPEQAGQPT
jgi:hypothetical protein